MILAPRKSLPLLLILIVHHHLEAATVTSSVATEDQACPDLCDLNSCVVPSTECLAGFVKDHCDCCYVCARKEGERCFQKDLPKQDLPEDYPRYPECGDDLVCQIRTDLEPTDKPEAVCYCTKTEPICGSDGVTYENQCQFTEARYQNRNKLFEVDNKPCKSPPKIISPPEDTTNNTGSSIAFACEATGWPLPTIKWNRLSGDDIETAIELDDQSQKHFEIKSNKSTNYANISWLQVMDAQREDSGVYVCVATNSEGVDKATAYLTIGNFQKRFDIVEE